MSGSTSLPGSQGQAEAMSTEDDLARETRQPADPEADMFEDPPAAHQDEPRTEGRENYGTAPFFEGSFDWVTLKESQRETRTPATKVQGLLRPIHVVEGACM